MGIKAEPITRHRVKVIYRTLSTLSYSFQLNDIFPRFGSQWTSTA